MVLQEKVTPPAAPAAGVVILRKSVQIVGELLITAGIILLLFVAWQLWWTNVASDAKQGEVNHVRTGAVSPPAFPFECKHDQKEGATRREDLRY